MSWLISLIVSGAVLASGSNLPNIGNDYITVGRSGNAAPVVLDETERFEKTYSFDSNGTIKISNINGSINIDSWDRNEIKFEDNNGYPGPELDNVFRIIAWEAVIGHPLSGVRDENLDGIGD